MTPRFAELFAGAGGLSLGLERAGWHSAWHAEIAPAPRAILTHHWPDVALYGDVTSLDGGALVALHGPIDLLAGGSPCQDLSVAGKRAGLAGERSGLFFEQMRLWQETGADLCLWENVDGARSSNQGKDFAAVLSAFVGGTVPVPGDGWRSAGVAAGPAGVAAWRVLDAQFFGVPQRRRRVFVLGTRTGRVDPAEVLSLAESVRGDSAESGEAGEGAAEGADGSIGFQGSQSGFRSVDTFATLDANYGSRRHNGVLSFDWQKGNDVNNRRPSTINVVEDATNTLGATRVPAVLAIDLAQVTNKDNRSQPQPPSPNGSGQVIAFGAQNSAAQGASASASASAKCTPSLDRSKVPAVCITGEQTHALTQGADASEDGTGRGTPVVANTVTAREGKGWEPENQVGNGTVAHGIPRRLTPRECERLQGWEDDWTLVPDAKGKPLSDAARYRAIGNGVASPVAEWIGERLYAALCPVGAPPQGTEPQPELLAVIRSSKREIVVVAVSSSRHPVSYPDILAESDTRARDGFDMNCGSAPTKEPTHE